ncbi:MAG TPA: diaminopimelate decarboxylase [Candidatus Baltobacteraceae bacterium]|nr:diaminopimelate decarboxylase [Candidatus Baltobacteraceae bacterium]
MHWQGSLAPGHGRQDGELLIGGARASELAQQYGTPLVALDYGVFDAAIAAFCDACAPHDIEVAYAGKALLLVALARHMKHTPLHLDVCSLGELAAAERAAFPAERISMHGCGKTDDELDAAADARVGRIIVDNLDELRRLARRGNAERPIPLLLRLNTGIEAHTHEFIRTSGDNTKFGFDPDALPEAIRLLQTQANLRFTGLHAHIGSQIYEQNAFTANAQALMESAAQCAAAGLDTQRVIVGGGFGVQMHPEEPSMLDLPATIAAIASTIRTQAQRLRIAVPRAGIEPGRALIAHAGTSLYTVMAAKTEFGRPYAVIDGGVYENPRPALYDAYHHTIAASRESSSLAQTVVCGRTCENDRLGVAHLPDDLRAGELVAMCTTGAYTYSMASNYNRFTRPAVVAVREGTHRLIARRESIDDVLRSDCDA